MNWNGSSIVLYMRGERCVNILRYNDLWMLWVLQNKLNNRPFCEKGDTQWSWLTTNPFSNEQCWGSCGSVSPYAHTAENRFLKKQRVRYTTYVKHIVLRWTPSRKYGCTPQTPQYLTWTSTTLTSWPIHPSVSAKQCSSDRCGVCDTEKLLSYLSILQTRARV